MSLFKHQLERVHQGTLRGAVHLRQVGLQIHGTRLLTDRLTCACKDTYEYPCIRSGFSYHALGFLGAYAARLANKEYSQP